MNPKYIIIGVVVLVVGYIVYKKFFAPLPAVKK